MNQTLLKVYLNIFLALLLPNLIYSDNGTRSDFSEPSSDESLLEDLIQDLGRNEYERHAIQLAVQSNVFGEGTSSGFSRKLEGTITRLLQLIRGEADFERPRRASIPYDDEARRLFVILKPPRHSSSSDPSSQETRKSDPNYEPDEDEYNFQADKIERSISTKRKIVELQQAGRSESQIKKLYPWYRRQLLPAFKKALLDHGTQANKMKLINQHVRGEFNKAREAGMPVRGFMLRDWGLMEAERLNATHFFHASTKWLHSFKTREGIVSRKVTKTIARRNVDPTTLQWRIDKFMDTYAEQRSKFYRRHIWNMDQVGFTYEIDTQRTLDWKGNRDTIIIPNQRGHQTHSYTLQPIVSREGEIIGKLLIALREPKGFGPRIGPEVRELEEKFGNIKIISAPSGKMDNERMAQWVETVLSDAVVDAGAVCPHENKTMCAAGDIDPPEVIEDVASLMRSDNRGIDDDDLDCAADLQGELIHWCRRYRNESYSMEECTQDAYRSVSRQCLNLPHILLLLDSWGGNRNTNLYRMARSRGVKILRIPEGTTGHVQPLDVGVFRQWKVFTGRIQFRAYHERCLASVTSRNGTINMQSLIWNQFSSPAYRQMLRYAWHDTDSSFDVMKELGTTGKPKKVIQIQFKLTSSHCQVENCTEHAFLRCSHCGKHLCLKHFLGRHCFHTSNRTAYETSDLFDVLNREGEVEDEDDIDEDDDNILELIDSIQRIAEHQTTPAPSSYHDELRKKRTILASFNRF